MPPTEWRVAGSYFERATAKPSAPFSKRHQDKIGTRLEPPYASASGFRVLLRTEKLDRRNGLISNDPCIMSGLHLICLPRDEVSLVSAFGGDVQRAGQDVSGVMRL